MHLSLAIYDANLDDDVITVVLKVKYCHFPIFSIVGKRPTLETS